MKHKSLGTLSTLPFESKVFKSKKLTSSYFLQIDHPLVTYCFNYLHVLFLCPNWIKWDSRKNAYIYGSTRPRKAISIMLLFIQGFLEIWDGNWQRVLEQDGGDFGITYFFDAVAFLFNIPTMWLILFIAWFRMDKLLVWIDRLKQQGPTISPLKGYGLCVMAHAILIFKRFSTEEERQELEHQVSRVANFVIHPKEWYQVLADNYWDYNDLKNVSTLSFKVTKMAFGGFILLVQSWFAFPETILLIVAFTLLMMAYQVERKFANESISIEEVCS